MVIVAAVVWIVSATSSGGTDEGDKVASIVASITALVSLAITALTLFFARSSVRVGSDETPSSVDLIARQLAASVRTLSAREEEHRRIDDPRPLSVQCHTASDELFDHWDNIHRATGETTPGRCR